MNRDRADHAYVRQLIDAAATFSRQMHISGAKCFAPDCGREFRSQGQLQDHAEAVHTFEDIRRVLNEYVREKFGRSGDYHASPIVPAIYTWVEDLAADWVVYTVEEANETTLYKAAYAISDDTVTLGEGVEVRRRTVYEPTKKD